MLNHLDQKKGNERATCNSIDRPSDARRVAYGFRVIDFKLQLSNIPFLKD